MPTAVHGTLVGGTMPVRVSALALAAWHFRNVCVLVDLVTWLALGIACEGVARGSEREFTKWVWRVERAICKRVATVGLSMPEAYLAMANAMLSWRAFCLWCFRAGRVRLPTDAQLVDSFVYLAARHSAGPDQEEIAIIVRGAHDVADFDRWCCTLLNIIGGSSAIR